MSDSDLRSHLASLQAPVVSETTRARALHRATIALATPTHPATSLPAATFSHLLLRPFATLLAAVLLLIVGGTFAPRPVKSNDWQAVLSELNQLFPGQLNALIESEGTLRLDLAPSPAHTSLPDASNDQSILLAFTRAGRHLRVFAYSGRPVRIELDGVPVRFDPLLTLDHTVVLSGDDFVWLPGQPAPRLLAGWRLEARPLTPIL